MFKKKKSTLLTEEAAIMEEDENLEEDIVDEGEEPSLKPKRFGANKRSLGIILMVLAIISIVVVNPAIKYFQESDYVTVYVAKSDIEKGAKIEKEMIEEISTPQSNAFKSMIFSENPAGKYAQTDIKKEDIITKSIIGDNLPFDQEYLYHIPEGKQVLAVTLNNYASGLSGYIQAGDIVSVYTYEGGKEAYQPEELKYVKVLDVTYSTNNENKTISTVLLSVNGTQAEKLVGIENSSSIHLSLINRFDSSESEKLLELQDEYLNGNKISETKESDKVKAEAEK